MVKKTTRSARTIKLSNESKSVLARMFGCTDRMVYKALCYECDTPLARRIRSVARMDMGGWIEASVPEEEIFYDTMDNGDRFMRQYYGNGAVLEINLTTGLAVVWWKGQSVKRYPELPVKLIPQLQELARSMS